MKDRIAGLHRQSASTQKKPESLDIATSRGAGKKTRRAIPWAFFTFIMGAIFVAWRFIPAPYLPAFLTYPVIMGGVEGRLQSEATNASMNAMAEAEGAKARATAPAAINQAVEIANQSAPIEIRKTVTITAEQARIEQVKSCRTGVMQGAGQTYTTCVDMGQEPGAACESKRDIILEKLPECGSLPGDAPEADAEPTE